MKTTSNFEDLFVWKESIILAKEIFTLFERCRIYSLRQQIERASLSIPTNIAEGFELGTKKQFSRHLYIAKGSAGEVRSLLYFALEVKAFSEETVRPFIDRFRKLSIMIYRLITAQTG